MITFTRRIAHQFRSVVRRAIGQARFAAVGFVGSKAGLIVRCAGEDAAVEYHVPGEQSDETIWLPLTALDDIEAKSDEIVQLTALDERAAASWHDKDGPQLTEYDSNPPRDADSFPTTPKELVENPLSILKGFSIASEIADPSPTRYALNNVRFRGDDGSMASTDGKQLLWQAGFHFPWKGDVLVPRNKVLGSRELVSETASIGKSDKWVTFVSGNWTVHLRIGDGRYPKIEDVVPTPDGAVGTCRLSASDAKFLAAALPKLVTDDNHCATLDLNGQVIVRAKNESDAKTSEIVLTGASWSGKATRVNVNYKQLVRAARLGLCDLNVYAKESPLCWRDGTRAYVTAMVTGDSFLEANADAIRLESPKATETAAPPATTQPRKKVKPVKETETTAAATSSTEVEQPKVKRRRASQQDLVALIDQAMAFRSELHSLVQQSNALVKSLKQHRRQSKAVQQTLASLRQLKSLGV